MVLPHFSQKLNGNWKSQIVDGAIIVASVVIVVLWFSIMMLMFLFDCIPSVTTLPFETEYFPKRRSINYDS